MNNLQEKIEDKLKTIYDPEFPMIDIFTLWLIYNVNCNEEEKKINITMSFTTPACPMAETIQEMIKNWILEITEDFSVNIEITFDPMRSPSMIRDEDLKKMFDIE